MLLLLVDTFFCLFLQWFAIQSRIEKKPMECKRGVSKSVQMNNVTPTLYLKLYQVSIFDASLISIHTPTQNGLFVVHFKKPQFKWLLCLTFLHFPRSIQQKFKVHLILNWRQQQQKKEARKAVNVTSACNEPIVCS